MSTNEVKQLLKRYFNAETTLQEEELLKEYFRKNSDLKELQPYAMYFEGLNPDEDVPSGSVESLMDYILEHEITAKIRYRQLWLRVTGIAASLLIITGGLLVYEQQKQPYRDTFDNPEEAMAYARQTLVFVSEKYNMGLAYLQPLQTLEKAARPLGDGLTSVNQGLTAIGLKNMNETNISDSHKKR